MPVYAGCDYLRLTDASHEHYGAWEEMLFPERVAEEHAGRKRHLRWILGYYGEVGEHYFYGKNESGTMVQVSGDLANRLFYPLSKIGGKATRVDLQITGVPTTDTSDFLNQSFYDACNVEHGRGKPALVQLVDTNYGAKMVTIGSRQSAVYGRVYDKWKESKDERYRDMVRLEIEVKQPESPSLHNFLLQDDMMVFQSKYLVKNWFEKRGVRMPYEIGETRELPEGQKRTKTHETKCAWISQQVRPSIADIVKADKAKQVAAALLPDDADNVTISTLAMLLSRVYRDYAS